MGLGAGFVTQDLARATGARMIALFYDWVEHLPFVWSSRTGHMEAITSRPLLLHAIRHAGCGMRDKQRSP